MNRMRIWSECTDALEENTEFNRKYNSGPDVNNSREIFFFFKALKSYLTLLFCALFFFISGFFLQSNEDSELILGLDPIFSV